MGTLARHMLIKKTFFINTFISKKQCKHLKSKKQIKNLHMCLSYTWICLSNNFIRNEFCFIMTHWILLLWHFIWRWNLVCWWVLLWLVLLWWVLLWCCLLDVTCMCNNHGWGCNITRLLDYNSSMKILNKTYSLSYYQQFKLLWLSWVLIILIVICHP